MLSQDTSRHFLHSSNPSAKFKLFMKGTHLEKIAHDYAQAEEQQRIMKEEIIRKKSMLPVLEMKAKQLEEEVQGQYIYMYSMCWYDTYLMQFVKCSVVYNVLSIGLVIGGVAVLYLFLLLLSLV